MKSKKETQLTVLKKIAKDIAQIRSALSVLVASDNLINSINQKPKNIFPQKTAKQIIEECNNTCETGKILCSGLEGWFKDEEFFTKETCRPISMEFTDILHKGKSWEECNKLGKMFNFAEIIYLLKESKEFRDMIGKQYQYTWTSSLSSDGRLVSVGNFASIGVDASRWEPGSTSSGLGVSLSRGE